MSNIIFDTRTDEDHEPIYNQEDMDGILAKLRDALRDAELTNQLLWAVVQAAGGEVFVPLTAWIVGLPEAKLEVMDDPANLKMRLRIVEE